MGKENKNKMSRKIVWVMASGAMVLMMLVASCSSAPTVAPTTSAPQTTAPSAASPAAKSGTTAAPAAETPKYGGTINLVTPNDVAQFDDQNQGGPSPGGGLGIVAETLWQGDWTKGNAGGYGTKATDWGVNGYDDFPNKIGVVATGWKINVNNEQATASITYTIRQGMHYGLDPTSDASKLVNGRELTADDVVESIKHGVTNPVDYLYRSNPELRTIDVQKTGPWEVTFNLPLSSLVSAMSRIGELQRFYAPEVRGKGVDWHSQVGSGPFMLTGYVSGSSLTYTKNPNYWGTDPIGPGKGNKVPYVDGLNVTIIPDPSTRVAAFRTGKIDQISGVDYETTAQLKKDLPQMPYADIGDWYSPGGPCIYMRTDKAPYSDVRVRRALMMATDFNAIKQNLNGGLGDIIGFPFSRYAGYEALYAGIDDPELTPAIKEQFVYSPDKAKALLADAGFPNGFKTNVLITSSQSSYYEMLAGMWAKAGITLDIKIMDYANLLNLLNGQGLTDLTPGTGFAPASIYYTGNIVNGVPGGSTNLSYVDDPVVKDLLPKIRTVAATDPSQAMKLAKQIELRALDQAWAIQIPSYRTTTFWQPWLKNYSGEISVGYYSIGNWTKYAWIDPTLKK